MPVSLMDVFFLNFFAAIIVSKIRLVEPQRLTSDLDYSISNFGFVDYQAQRMVELRLWNSPDGCDTPTDQVLELSKNQTIGFLMKKGGCSYLRQSINAHRAGAYLVFVFDIEQDDKSSLTTPTAENSDANGHVLPPVVMIRSKKGELLWKALEAGEKVIVSVDFDIDVYKPPVSVALVFSAEDYKSIDIYRSLILFQLKTMNNKTNNPEELMFLEAIPKIYSKKDFNLTTTDVRKYCIEESDLCVNPHPRLQFRDPFDEIRIAGFFICLQQHQSEGNKTKNLIEIERILKDYSVLLSMQEANKAVLDMREHAKNYFNSNSSFLKNSLNCYKENFASEVLKNKINLEFVKGAAAVEFPSPKLPSLYIQDKLVRGDLTKMGAVSAVCDVLPIKFQPKICKGVEEFMKKESEKLIDDTTGPSTMTTLATLWTLLLVMVVFIALICVVSLTMMKKRVRADIISEIDKSLERYYQIQNTKLEVAPRDSELIANNL